MNHRYIDFVPQNQPKEEIPEEKPIIHISFAGDEPEVYTEEYADDAYSEEYVDEEVLINDYDSEEPESVSIRKITTITPTETSEITEVVRVSAEPEVEEEAPEEPETPEEFDEEEPEIDLDTPIEELMAPKDDDNFDFGVVEDYVPVNDKRPAFITSTPAFTNTKVEKRPLYDRSDIEKIKAERLLKKPIEKPVEKPVEEPKKSDDLFRTPKKSPFINTNLIEKRPLSKTNYRDRAPIVKEEESGPITIIDNEGKNSRFGLILTIVLTIILGAAVGTIAFLLVPR